MHNYRVPVREASFGGDLRYILRILRAKALIIALCLAGAVGLGFLYLKVTPKVYSAKAVLQVDQEEPSVVKIDAVRNEDLKAPEVLRTYEQNILSPDVLLRVLKNPDLKNDPDFLPEVKSPRSDNALQAALGARITAKIRRESRLIDVSVEDSVPARAQRIAELLIKEFILWNSEARREAARTANRFLHEQAAEIVSRLEKSEAALQAYKELHGEVSLQSKQSGTAEALVRLNQRIAETRAERLKLEADAAQIVTKSTHSTAELLNFPSIASAPTVADLVKKLGDKEASIAPLQLRYRSGHPSLAAAQTEVDQLRAMLASAASQAATQLENRLREMRLTEEKLQVALLEQQKVSLGEDAVAIGFAALTRDVEANRALFEMVLKRTKETDVTKELAQEVVHVVARPLLPDLPVKPRKTLVLALSLLAGLGGGCFIAFATHAADRSLQTLEDAEKRLGLRSLGEIPKLPAARKRLGKAAALVESDIVAAESFCSLSTSLSLLQDGSSRKKILFTSAHAGEGKTFCAINCAVSFAQSGLKTLLIDADFRLPSIERIFFDKQKPQGMSELLLDLTHLGQSVHPTDVENLHVLPAGQPVGRPAELLNRSRLAAILEKVGDDFDRIVIDTAPVHLVSDTLLLVKHVDYVCLVVRAGETPAEDVLRTSRRLAEAGAPPVGFVWNQVKPVKAYHEYYERAAATRGYRRLLG